MGKFNLNELRPKDIVNARDRIRRGEGRKNLNNKDLKPRSNSTVNTYIAGISTVLQVSLELWGWIEENPCRKIRRLPVDNQRVRYLEPDERERLLEVCRNDKDLMDVVCLALLTGARQSEICCLRWEHVGFDERLLFFMDTKIKPTERFL